MSRKSKRNRPPVPRRPTTPTMSVPPASAPVSVPAAPDASRGKIRQAGSRLFNSAVDTTLENFWIYFWSLVGGAIGPALMAMLVATILYLRSPESAWFYTLLKYTFVFLTGTLLPILVLVSLASIGVYRKKKKEKDRVHKYASTDKAWVDFSAELEPAFNRFSGLLVEIGRETIDVSKRSNELIAAVLIPDPQQRRKMTSKRAKALNKNCLKMEIAAEHLAEARDAYFDVAEGLLKTTPPASEGNGPKLMEVRDALNEMTDSAITVIQSQKDLMQTSKAVYGTVSMDVNTSVNWLVAVCQENVRIIEVYRTRMSRDLMPLLETKLRS